MWCSGLIRCVLISNKGVNNVLKPCSCLCQSQLQSIRGFRRSHVRKPIYLGTAKSKLLRFPNWVPYKPGEGEEMKKLSNDYRHAMKSIFAYFKQEYAKVSETSHIVTEKQKADEEEHIRLMEENRLENERIAKIREARVAANVLEKKEKLLNSLAFAEEKEELRMEQVNAIVREMQEKVSACITPETLDAAIEQALANEVDYNFAIDLDGNVYRGRNTNQLQTSEKNEMKA